MKLNPRVLYLVPPNQPESSAFVELLKSSLTGYQVQIDKISWTTGFQLSGYDLVHAFLPAASGSIDRLRSKASEGKILITLTAGSNEAEDYRKLPAGSQVVVFTDEEKKTISEQAPGLNVEVIPPCARQLDFSALSPAADTRAKYGADERMMAVALNEIRNEEQFKTFLYVAREYNRKEDFRFVIPTFSTDREASTWRSKLRASVELEKLDSAVFVDESTDLQLLIDACDLTLYTKRKSASGFDLPTLIVEVLLAGRPVICYQNTAPAQVIAKFQQNWIARAMEDFVRISRDIGRDAPRLEQISTDLARYSRSLLSPEKVSQQYSNLYQNMLGREE